MTGLRTDGGGDQTEHRYPPRVRSEPLGSAMLRSMRSTRSAIRRAGLGVFLDGASGLGLREVARATPISATGIYHHFDDVEDLTLSVERLAVAEIRRRVGPDDLARLIWELHHDDGLGEALLGFERQHARWPAHFAARLTGLDVGLASGVLDDVLAVCGHRRARSLPPFDADELRLIVGVFANVAQRLARADSFVPEVPSASDFRSVTEEVIDDEPDHRRRALLGAMLDQVLESGTFTTRGLTARSGLTPPEIYRVGNHEELRALLDDRLGAAFLEIRDHVLETVLATMHKLVVYGHGEPELFSYVSKRASPDEGPLEAFVKAGVTEARHRGLLQLPDITDEQHLSLMLGPFVRRFRNRHLEPERWDETVRLSSVLHTALFGTRVDDLFDVLDAASAS